MNKIISYLKTRTPGWHVAFASLLVGLIGLIVYVARGGNTYSPVSVGAVTTFSIGLIINLLILIKDFKIGAYIPFILYSITLAILLNSEMLFISNVLTGIDNNSFDSAFIIFLILFILTDGLSFASTIMTIHRKESK